MTNEELFQQAYNAVEKFFCDKSVSDEQIKEKLEDLIIMIKIMIAALENKE